MSVLLKQSAGRRTFISNSPRTRDSPPPPPLRSMALFEYRGSTRSANGHAPARPRSSASRCSFTELPSEAELLHAATSTCVPQPRLASPYEITTIEASLCGPAHHSRACRLHCEHADNADVPADGADTFQTPRNAGATARSDIKLVTFAPLSLPPPHDFLSAARARPSSGARATLLERFERVDMLAQHLGVSSVNVAERFVAPMVSASTAW